MKEYLISDRIGKSPAIGYALNEALSHSFITKCCLIYLLQFRAPLNPDSVRTFPLVPYATRFWTHHFQVSGVTDREELENMAFTLLTSDQVRYVSWCQFYDPDKPWIVQWNDGDWLEANGSPLYYMSLLGLSQLCKRLLAANADPNAAGGLFCTPLLAASKNGHQNVVELLLVSKADPNLTNGRDTSPLIVAATGGYLTIVESLLSHGVRVDQESISQRFRGTAMDAAVRHGHEGVVQTFLNAGPRARTRFTHHSGRKWTKGPPIVEAASNGHDIIVRQLLPSSSAFGIQEAINAAASKGHENVVRLLIEDKTTDLELALSCAMRVGAHDMVSRLIREGARINKDTRLKRHTRISNTKHLSIATPLESAIIGGHELIMQRLIADGASYDPDMLSLAVKNGHARIVRCLIRQYRHEPVNLSRPLVAAIQNSFKSIVELLLDNGADIEHEDSWYGRPLQVAVKSGNLDLLKFLVGRGAGINSEGGPESRGVLQSAASRGRLPMVRFLVEHGADPEMYGDE